MEFHIENLNLEQSFDLWNLSVQREPIHQFETLLYRV